MGRRASGVFGKIRKSRRQRNLDPEQSDLSDHHVTTHSQSKPLGSSSGDNEVCFSKETRVVQNEEQARSPIKQQKVEASLTESSFHEPEKPAEAALSSRETSAESSESTLTDSSNTDVLGFLPAASLLRQAAEKIKKADVSQPNEQQVSPSKAVSHHSVVHAQSLPAKTEHLIDKEVENDGTQKTQGRIDAQVYEAKDSSNDFVGSREDVGANRENKHDVGTHGRQPSMTRAQQYLAAKGISENTLLALYGALPPGIRIYRPSPSKPRANTHHGDPSQPSVSDAWLHQKNRDATRTPAPPMQGPIGRQFGTDVANSLHSSAITHGGGNLHVGDSVSSNGRPQKGMGSEGRTYKHTKNSVPIASTNPQDVQRNLLDENQYEFAGDEMEFEEEDEETQREKWNAFLNYDTQLSPSAYIPPGEMKSPRKDRNPQASNRNRTLVRRSPRKHAPSILMDVKSGFRAESTITEEELDIIREFMVKEALEMKEAGDESVGAIMELGTELLERIDEERRDAPQEQKVIVPQPSGERPPRPPVESRPPRPPMESRPPRPPLESRPPRPPLESRPRLRQEEMAVAARDENDMQGNQNDYVDDNDGIGEQQTQRPSDRNVTAEYLKKNLPKASKKQKHRSILTSKPPKDPYEVQRREGEKCKRHLDDEGPARNDPRCAKRHKSNVQITEGREDEYAEHDFGEDGGLDQRSRAEEHLSKGPKKRQAEREIDDETTRINTEKRRRLDEGQVTQGGLRDDRREPTNSRAIEQAVHTILADSDEDEDEPASGRKNKRRKRSDRRRKKEKGGSGQNEGDANADDVDETRPPKTPLPWQIKFYSGETLELIRLALFYMLLYLLCKNAYPNLSQQYRLAEKFYVVACRIKYGPDYKKRMPKFTDGMSTLLRNESWVLRNKVKRIVKDVVDRAYGLHPPPESFTTSTNPNTIEREKKRYIQQKVEALLSKPAPFLCGRNENTLSVPFAHPAIAEVVGCLAFCPKTTTRPPASIDFKAFDPVPLPLIAYACAGLRYALDEYKTGTRTKLKFNELHYAKHYRKYLRGLKGMEMSRSQGHLLADIRDAMLDRGRALLRGFLDVDDDSDVGPFIPSSDVEIEDTVDEGDHNLSDSESDGEY